MENLAHAGTVVLNRGRSLAADIEKAIRDVVMSNAPHIRDFTTRQDELATVDTMFLLLYSISVVAYFASLQGEWSEHEIDQVLTAAGNDLGATMSFLGAAPVDRKAVCNEICEDLRGMFENVRGNLNHLMESVREDDAAVIKFNFIYLRRVYPPALTFFGESKPISVALQQCFSELTFSAMHYVEAPANQEKEAVPAGWYPDPWRQSRLRYWDGQQWTGHTA
jgi:Protein of unknown function (DUF2510)